MQPGRKTSGEDTAARSGAGRYWMAVNRLCEVCCGACLILIAGFTLYEIVCRYVFDSPTQWTQDFSIYLMIWCTFLGPGNIFVSMSGISVFPPVRRRDSRCSSTSPWPVSRRLERVVENNWGSESNPLSASDVRQKFRDNAMLVVDDRKIDQLLALADRLEDVRDINDFVSLCVNPDRRSPSN